MAPLQKMGVARNGGLERTGSQNRMGWAALQCLFHAQTHFLAAPLCGAKAAGQALVWAAHRSSHSRAGILPVSSIRGCTSHESLGRVSRCALVPGGYTRARPSELRLLLL